VARAALLDTIDTVDGVSDATVTGRCLVLDGVASSVDDRDWAQAGWTLHPQRGGSLGHRIATAFLDTAVEGAASLLVGMDTPQIDSPLLERSIRELSTADAVLGPAADGGWWLLGLREPRHASFIRDVPTSRSDTGERTRAALSQAGLAIADAPLLSDVDTADDARRVAALCRPGAHFVTAVTRNLPVSNGHRSSTHVRTPR
jgi:glycosyltransferase A (GT-A) superfamily protein (DUF2064 family)